jgi:hypothetical protein
MIEVTYPESSIEAMATQDYPTATYVEWDNDGYLTLYTTGRQVVAVYAPKVWHHVNVIPEEDS